MEGDTFLKEEEKKLLYFSQNLANCDRLTENMMGLLDNFEVRLDNLEKAMLPIHENTQLLSLSQRNIDKTIKEVDLVLQYQMLAGETDKGIQSIHRDYVAYIERLERVKQASRFFQANRKFKHSEKMVKKLNDLTKSSTVNLESYFKRIVKDYTKPLNLDQTAWPLPDDFELIPSGTLFQFGRVASCLEHARAHDSGGLLAEYAVAYADERARTMSLSLRTLFDREEKQRSELDEKSLSAYKKGSHPFNFRAQFFTKLAEIEHEMIIKLTEMSGMMEDEQGRIFNRIATEPLDIMLSLGQDVLNEKRDRKKVLILLDILGNWRALLPKFQNLFSEDIDEGKNMKRILHFETQLKDAARSEIEEKVQSILDHPAKDIRKDGGYHTITVATMGFLKHLSEYADILEFVIPASDKDRFGQTGHKFRKPSDFSTDDRAEEQQQISAIGQLVSDFLEVLEKNLTAKTKYFKNDALVHIFLLNNFNYVSKHVRASELAYLVPGAFVPTYQRLIVNERNMYRKESWGKLLQYLNCDKLPSFAPQDSVPNAFKKDIKSKFLGFNENFGSLFSTQKQFSVPDSDLRSQLRNENVELIVPHYKCFYEKFSNTQFTSNQSKYVKYHVASIEQMLNKFFDEEA
eukprot:47262_1